MKPSYYNFYFEIRGMKIVYNSLHSTISEVDAGLFDSLRSGNFISDLYSGEVLEFLLSKGICINENMDETAHYLEQFERNRDTDVLQVQLLLATACNLRCSYCYLSNVVEKGIVMGSSEKKRFLRWIATEAKTVKFRKVYLEFYGGEPLMAKRFLPEILVELSRLEKETGIQIDYGMTTNGTLLDDDLINLLVSHSVFMQITIDGARETHDKRRVNINGEGTYDKIICNIKKVIEFGGNENLKVRMNIDEGNWSDIDFVAKQCHSLGVKNFEVGWVAFLSPIAPEYQLQVSEDHFEARMLELFKILDPYGYAPCIDDFKILTTCMLHRYNGFVINPKLEVFKCDEVVDKEQYKIGFIDADGIMQLNPDAFGRYIQREPSNYAECLKCKCLPVCGSGCAVKALRSNGDFNKSFCETNEHKLRIRVENYIEAQLYKQQQDISKA